MEITNHYESSEYPERNEYHLIMYFKSLDERLNFENKLLELAKPNAAELKINKTKIIMNAYIDKWVMQMPVLKQKKMKR